MRNAILAVFVLYLLAQGACRLGSHVLRSAFSGAASPAAAANPDSPAAPAPAALTASEQAALSLYENWRAARERYDGQHVNGQVKIDMTQSQSQRDFANPLGTGVIPTTKDGADLLKKSVEGVMATAKEMQSAERQAYADADAQPAEVREIFRVLLPPPGPAKPRVDAGAAKVYFVYSKQHDDYMMNDSSAPVLDAADQSRLSQLYAWDLKDGSIKLVSEGDPEGVVETYAISDDGFVAFMPGRNRWAAGGPRAPDVAVRGPSGGALDRLIPAGDLVLAGGAKPIPPGSRAITLYSLSSDGSKALIAAGNVYGDQYNGFEEYHSIVRLDRASKTATALTRPLEREPWAALSADGLTAAVIAKPAAFGVKPAPDQKEGLYLIAGAGKPELVPLPDGVNLDAAPRLGRTPVALSRDGKRLVVWASLGGASRIFFWERGTPSAKIVSVDENGAVARSAGNPSLSADGNLVAFDSDGSVYLRDIAAGKTVLVSRNAQGKPSAGTAEAPSLSADGSAVAFVSNAQDIPLPLSAALSSRVKVQRAKRLWLYLVKEDRFLTLGQRR